MPVSKRQTDVARLLMLLMKVLNKYTSLGHRPMIVCRIPGYPDDSPVQIGRWEADEPSRTFEMFTYPAERSFNEVYNQYIEKLEKEHNVVINRQQYPMGRCLCFILKEISRMHSKNRERIMNYEYVPFDFGLSKRLLEGTFHQTMAWRAMLDGLLAKRQPISEVHRLLREFYIRLLPPVVAAPAQQVHSRAFQAPRYQRLQRHASTSPRLVRITPSAIPTTGRRLIIMGEKPPIWRGTRPFDATQDKARAITRIPKALPFQPDSEIRDMIEFNY